MTLRRGTGEGSVYRRESTGAWHGTVDLGRGPDGRRQRKTVTGKTKRQVLAKLAEVQSRQAAGAPPTDDRQTTASYLTYWLDNVLAGTVKDSTETSYRWIVGKYLVPSLGAIPLAKLAPSDVQSMMRRLERQGLSGRTRQYARAILRRALGHAVKEERVRRNVAALVDSPKGAGTKLDDALTAEEAKLVLDAARGDRLEAMAILALSLGLRRGELLGLRWRDVDLDAGTLTISQTVSRISGRGLVVSTPKTDNAARTIPLVSRARTALEDHRRRQADEHRIAGSEWIDSGHVFTTPTGTVLDPANAYHWWRRLTERSGVGGRRLHASRHTCATLLLDQGVPLEVVSAVLGHAGLAITADIYARPTMDAKRRGLAAIANALGEN